MMPSRARPGPAMQGRATGSACSGRAAAMLKRRTGICSAVTRQRCRRSPALPPRCPLRPAPASSSRSPTAPSSRICPRMPPSRSPGSIAAMRRPGPPISCRGPSWTLSRRRAETVRLRRLRAVRGAGDPQASAQHMEVAERPPSRCRLLAPWPGRRARSWRVVAALRDAPIPAVNQDRPTRRTSRSCHSLSGCATATPMGPRAGASMPGWWRARTMRAPGRSSKRSRPISITSRP